MGYRNRQGLLSDGNQLQLAHHTDIGFLNELEAEVLQTLVHGKVAIVGIQHLPEEITVEQLRIIRPQGEAQADYRLCRDVDINLPILLVLDRHPVATARIPPFKAFS